MFTFAPDFSGLDPDTGEPWSVKKVVELMGLKRASNEETRSACVKVVEANPDKVDAYKKGKTNLIGFFIKLVMDETNRQASPQEATKILTELLTSPNPLETTS
jgi:aspartyl-tRNA(Asn)/glutamyl-tRNA(Gln) amidotransferase subunit B